MMKGDNHMEETWAARSWTALRTLLRQSAFGFLGPATSVAPQRVSPRSAVPARTMPVCWVPLLLSRAA